jgi:hypothetical protein
MHSLIPAYRAMHAKGRFAGYSIRPHLGQITDLVMESGAKTLLDYGCGAGKQYTEECWHMLWGFRPALYDPAVAAFSRCPTGQFDGVICTDVLEHVPADELETVVADLVGYARQWCFISVCCRRSKKHFPDGTNMHVTIREPEWWSGMLGERFAGRAALHLAFTP